MGRAPCVRRWVQLWLRVGLVAYAASHAASTLGFIQMRVVPVPEIRAGQPRRVWTSAVLATSLAPLPSQAWKGRCSTVQHVLTTSDDLDLTVSQ